MTPEKAIELLTPLKRSEFIPRHFTNCKDKCCVAGHLIRLTSEDPTDYSPDNCSTGYSVELQKLLWYTGKSDCTGYSSLVDANNGNHSRYLQKTCKGRVMAFLRDIIKIREKGEDIDLYS
jgi:hypothetical protein